MNKKILLLITTVILITSRCAWADLANSENGNNLKLDSANSLQQIYRQNKYIIKQLEKLARAKGKLPHRIGAQLSKPDITLLIIKQSSLNYLMQSDHHSGIEFQPFKEKHKIDEKELLLQSKILLSRLPNLFTDYQLPHPAKFNGSSTSSWFEPTASYAVLYNQQVRLESLLYGLKNVIKPKDVYDVALFTRELISKNCESSNNIQAKPLIMGKRPKDVYALFYRYLNLLSKHHKVPIPAKGPIHIYPHDVFDIAIVAMSYSLQIQKEDELHVDLDDFDYPIKPDNITPSHVYQAIAQNISVLECLPHAS